MFNKLIELLAKQPNWSLDVSDRNIMIETLSGKKLPATEIGFDGDCLGVFIGKYFYDWEHLTYTDVIQIYRAIDY